jgi:hypothetical protein
MKKIFGPLKDNFSKESAKSKPTIKGMKKSFRVRGIIFLFIGILSVFVPEALDSIFPGALIESKIDFDVIPFASVIILLLGLFFLLSQHKVMLVYSAMFFIFAGIATVVSGDGYSLWTIIRHHALGIVLIIWGINDFKKIKIYENVKCKTGN